MKTISTITLLLVGSFMLGAEAPKEPKPVDKDHQAILDYGKVQIENAGLKMTLVQKEYQITERKLSDLRTEHAKYVAEQKTAQGKLDGVVAELKKSHNADGYELDLTTYNWKKVEPKKEAAKK
jgi:hypothetical protein